MSPTPETLGQRVRKLRQKLDITQAALAREIGRQTLAVSEIERGETDVPRGDTLSRLAEALGTTADYLLHGDDAPVVHEPIPNETLVDLVAQVAAELGLPPEVERELRASQWNLGLPSYGTLRSYAVDLLGQRSGKLRLVAPTKVELPADAPRVAGKRPRAKG